MSSVKVDIDEEAGVRSPKRNAVFLLNSTNVSDEAGDGTPLSLGDFRRVDLVLAADELDSVAEEHVEAGVRSPDSEVRPRSSCEISDISVNSVKVEMVEPAIEAADDAHIALRAFELDDWSETRLGTYLSRSSTYISGRCQFEFTLRLNTAAHQNRKCTYARRLHKLDSGACHKVASSCLRQFS